MTSINQEEYGSCPACCAILSHGLGCATLVQRRVADLISQNIRPNDEEAHDLLHADLDPAPYFAQIEQRMSELTKEMARLSAARAHLQRHPYHVKAILHPIRALPQEIIREVFLWSAWSWNDHAMDSVHDSLYHLRPQWVFSQVCRRWRDIALSFPRFWSSLYLNLGAPAYVDPAVVPRAISRLATYLDRSGKQKLDVGIILPSGLFASEFHPLGAVLRASTPRWARWKLDATFEFLDIFSSCYFFSLTHLCLDLYSEEPENKGKVAFENTPLLRHVDYRSSVYDESRILLPWEQLCTLKMAELNGPFVDGPLQRLESVQRLQLQLSDTTVKRDSLISLPSLRLPSLTALILYGLTQWNGDKTGLLVSRLDMPALTDLELIFGADYAEDEDAGIYAASPITFPPFHPSVCLDQLVSLFISCPLDNQTNDAEKLIGFLRHAHNLHKFVLCDCDISFPIIDALTLRDGHCNLFPRLQVLDFRGSDLYEDVRITHILSMLASRCPGQETHSRSALAQLFLSADILRKIGECMKLCFDDEFRGRWDLIFTSILVR